MDELIAYGGTAEGCPVEWCPVRWDRAPFASDAEAVAHLAQHSINDLAWSLLTYKALVQHILGAVDQPGGIRTEQHMEELMQDVDDTAARSPARPQ
ncbi:hypothetical protein [Streptomyces sp. NPDC053048]|uniref:hypothetical protein n=1 Tax=Streptomyces sp. NPDC053048 TaxID=3365694 RepID=UPI0037CDF227